MEGIMPIQAIKVPIKRKQSDSSSCGVVAAAVVLDILGWEKEEVDRLVSEQIPYSMMDGTHTATIEAFLRRLGCKVTSGDMDIKDLNYHTKRSKPVVCLITAEGGSGHWVVVIRATQKFVSYFDPYLGKVKRIIAKDFVDRWYDFDKVGTEYFNFGLVVSNW
jgi:ABC-type bacteriocin/lantibiotic exporter with double-glycine peptidase domain